MSFRNYNFLSYLLTAMSSLKEADCGEWILRLLGRQDKALAMLRSSFANSNLLHKIAHIGYYSAGALLVALLMLGLVVRWWVVRGRSEWRKVSEAEGEEKEGTCGKVGTRLST